MKLKNCNALAIVGLVWLAVRATACGPCFPNNLLDSGDSAILQAPVADFESELTRLQLVPAITRAVPLREDQTYADQTTAAEMNDLAAALKRNGTADTLATVILERHLTERMKLNAYLACRTAYEEDPNNWQTNEDGQPTEVDEDDAPEFPEISVTPGLPEEFNDYFQAALADAADADYTAIDLWNDILKLPAAQRHYKSTWAAFMIGKCEAANTNAYSAEEAAKYFEQVRTLAKTGFADPLGLATASLGEEARVYLEQADYGRAIPLYLQEFAAGDATAINSLRFTIRQIFNDTNFATTDLTTLATNALTRRVITAYLISRNPYLNPSEGDNDPLAREFFDRTAAWLDAVEKAHVQDVEFASQFALTAYQASQMDLAQRWVNRAGHEPVAQWLQAKLDLRAGKTDEAARLLTKLCRQFPAADTATNVHGPFAASLRVNINDMSPEYIPVGQQAWGELGALHLARREYTEALDCLMRSDYWMDAAYVAERVLTIDELKSYVDREWPAARAEREARNASDGQSTPAENIRSLLARRLARAQRFGEARAYFMPELQTQVDQLVAALQKAHDLSQPQTQRAAAFYAAAWLTRTNGMEIYGTEAAPDWANNGGSFSGGGVDPESRTNQSPNILAPTQDELVRARQSEPVPDRRFHYRFLAADLAFQAGSLMPDNSDDTARVLCTGGSWIKYLDAAQADPIYKALVRRCRKTAIGAQADRMRWFPVLDDSGNPLPYPPPHKPDEPATQPGIPPALQI